VALDATDAGTFNNLGLLLKKKGDTEGANVAFAKAAAIRKADEERKEKNLRSGTPR
jgi:Flp pilus assembly protein TadD